jgi:hypothetical protein
VCSERIRDVPCVDFAMQGVTESNEEINKL